MTKDLTLPIYKLFQVFVLIIKRSSTLDAKNNIVLLYIIAKSKKKHASKLKLKLLSTEEHLR